MLPAGIHRSLALLLLSASLLLSALPLACSSDAGGGQGGSAGNGTSSSSSSNGGGAATGGASAGGSGGSGGSSIDAGPDQLAPAVLGVVSVAELVAELPGKGFRLINVHIPYEGNIPGTDVGISYLDVPAIAAYLGPNLDEEVVVYCMTNYMSTIAGEGLVDLGYRQVRYLDGGMVAWKAAGQPIDP